MSFSMISFHTSWNGEKVICAATLKEIRKPLFPEKAVYLSITFFLLLFVITSCLRTSYPHWNIGLVRCHLEYHPASHWFEACSPETLGLSYTVTKAHAGVIANRPGLKASLAGQLESSRRYHGKWTDPENSNAFWFHSNGETCSQWREGTLLKRKLLLTLGSSVLIPVVLLFWLVHISGFLPFHRSLFYIWTYFLNNTFSFWLRKVTDFWAYGSWKNYVGLSTSLFYNFQVFGHWLHFFFFLPWLHSPYSVLLLVNIT